AHTRARGRARGAARDQDIRLDDAIEVVAIEAACEDVDAYRQRSGTRDDVTQVRAHTLGIQRFSEQCTRGLIEAGKMQIESAHAAFFDAQRGEVAVVRLHDRAQIVRARGGAVELDAFVRIRHGNASCASGSRTPEVASASLAGSALAKNACTSESSRVTGIGGRLL